ncbi:hypothetical protein LSCM1_04831 [Leishmania martiniquensis]|uniref:Uncharacterized protein n=1 Tax=Leishmania martiniquensis TaxID=1580590 RepID=A0A836KPX4_9TRYP|nr:hypothetical protein LSCM1_04831 [Leishmania martiniquensis]
MQFAQPASRVVRRCRGDPALSHLLRRHVWALPVAKTSPAALCIALRRHSQQASRWLNKLRYGADDAPTMGSWDSAYEDRTLDTRQLYCKALVHASGGSRLARDWIAGCAALTSPDPSLICTALQHNATQADVEALREHIIGRLLAQESPKRGDRSGASRENEVRTKFDGSEESEEVEMEPYTGDAAAEVAVASNSAVPCSIHEGNDEDGTGEVASSLITLESIRNAERYLLQHSREVRCFMYDAMTASLFHRNNDLRAVEAARRHTFWVGSALFGLSFDELTELWRLVEAELLLKKEKLKVLGQPWGE